MPDQLPLFGFHEMRPKVKLRKVISPERIREIKEAMNNGSIRDQIEAMRNFNDILGNFERRIVNR